MNSNAEPNVNLNPPSRKPVTRAPWSDDKLQRQSIAFELAALAAGLATGKESAAIALDGAYGTGKTFILERWVQDRQDRGQVAVYYNAWENDCDDDPLVSLIEGLVSSDKTNWGDTAKRNVNVALTGIVHRFAGIDIRKMRLVKDGETPDLLDAAAERRRSRQELKRILAEFVDTTKDHGAPIVVVIDELDRCRPTFATELMERVKHVLNVSGIVFVFGVNITALRETVKAVYGNIEAHQYLLRFFTTTLSMPRGAAFQGHNSGSQWRDYLEGLAKRYGLLQFCTKHRQLRDDLDNALNLLELAADAGGFTPRELERVMWLLGKVALSSLSLGGRVSVIHPNVLVPLAITRVKAPDAYYRTASIPDNAPAVLDCLFDLMREVSPNERLDELEMTMYRVCHDCPMLVQASQLEASQPPAYAALRKFAEEGRGVALDSRHLSRRSSQVTKERAKALLEAAPPEFIQSVSVRLGFDFLQELTSRFDVIWPRP